MAFVATKVKDSDDVFGKHRTVMFDIALGTYATGGVAISPSLVGLKLIRGGMVIGGNAASAGYSIVFDTTNKKLVAARAGAHSHDLLLKNAAVADGATTRVNAGTNLLGANTGSDVPVAGGGANGGVQASTQGALAEVSNGVDLTSVVVRVLFIGV
jgi:hypothetical protein